MFKPGRHFLQIPGPTNLPYKVLRATDHPTMDHRSPDHYMPATNLLYGPIVVIDRLHAEELENVFTRHQRHTEATRRTVQAWEMEVLCRVPEYYSGALTAVLMPEGVSADA